MALGDVAEHQGEDEEEYMDEDNEEEYVDEDKVRNLMRQCGLELLGYDNNLPMMKALDSAIYAMGIEAHGTLPEKVPSP